MSAENIVAVKSTSDDISSDDGEDKKFVSQAVAFVIGHARNGFVALCASVANLLKDQARLKQEVETLQQEVLQLKQKIKKSDKSKYAMKKEECMLLKAPSSCEFKHLINAKPSIDDKWETSVPKNKSPKIIPFNPLNGCICNQCAEKATQPRLTVPLSEGAKVVIRGDISGIVHYIGHVDAFEFPEIYVGIQLSEPLGDSDGSVGNKVYFSVPFGYGIFVPLTHILCILR